MSEDGKFHMASPGPTGEMGQPRNLPIGLAKFFRLGFDQKLGGKLFLKPKVNGYARVDVNGDFPAIIGDYVLGKKKIPGNYKEEPTPSKKGRTHLSLHADSACYVVIELDDSIAWTYPESSTPFSTIAIDGTDLIFSEPTLCWKNGAGGVSTETITSLGAGKPNAKTNWAYFVFDYGSIPQLERNDFFVGFNIHVALYPDDAGSPPIPITIDPDVGHPGGQGN